MYPIVHGFDLGREASFGSKNGFQRIKESLEEIRPL
jgi:hypothetical protein